MGELTSEEMERLRVRLADLPRFDPEGLRVEYDHPRSGLGQMLCVGWDGVEQDGRRWLRVTSPGLGTVRELGRLGSVREDVATVSTADARTRDALARWVADRVRLPQPTAGKITTAPCFEWTDFGGVWVLTNYRGTPRMFSHRDVPGVDPLDRRLLPDGSRWADAAALAAVCGRCVDQERAP